MKVTNASEETIELEPGEVLHCTGSKIQKNQCGKLMEVIVEHVIRQPE